jgi:hypothetical protein
VRYYVQLLPHALAIDVYLICNGQVYVACSGLIVTESGRETNERPRGRAGSGLCKCERFRR